MIAKLVSFALKQPFLIVVARHRHDDLGRLVLPEAAHRRLSRPFAAARGTHHAMARPRLRRGRAPGHHPARNRTERHSAARFAALHLALRAVLHRHELRVRRGPILRPRAGLRAHAQRADARRHHAQPFAHVQPERPHLPLRGAESRPFSAGLEDHRRLGAGAPLPLHPGRGRRFRFRRHHHAIPGAAGSQQALRLRRLRAADLPATGQQQRQFRRRLLFAGRTVLLHPRPRPGARPGRHRQRHRAGEERHPGERQGCRPSADRLRAAARPVRLHETERGRGGRHPDARGRAGAGHPAARRGDDQGIERACAAARRESRPVLRPPGSDRRDHQDRGGQPAPRHAPGPRDPRHFPLQHPDSADCRRHDPLRPAVLLHLPRLAAHPGQPALHRRHRFRNHRGRLGGDGREHFPRTGGATRPGLQPGRCDSRRGARCRAAHLLRHRRDHRRLHPHLRADRPLRAAVPAHGRYHVVRAAGRAALCPHRAAGTVLGFSARPHPRA